MAEKNIPGYLFPNIPARWSLEEKNFALGLQGVFDLLFSRIKTMRENRALVDYLFMTAEIDNPTDTGSKVKKVGEYYRRGFWNIQMVWDAVGKSWITSEDYEKITGDTFPVVRPE